MDNRTIIQLTPFENMIVQVTPFGNSIIQVTPFENFIVVVPEGESEEGIFDDTFDETFE